MVDRITLTRDDIADDWPKIRTWGFPDVNTYDEFIGMVGDDEETVGAFVQLPAWNPAPQQIKDGVAAAYPNLVPLFFTMPEVLTKHLDGKHDQLSHGAWAGVNRDTPEYQAKMERVEEKRRDGKVLPSTDYRLWEMLDQYGNPEEWGFELPQSYIDEHFSDEYEEALSEVTSSMYGDDYIMLTEDQVNAASLAAYERLQAEATEYYREDLEAAGYDPDAFTRAFSHQSADGRFQSIVGDVEYDYYEQNVTVRGSLWADGDEVGEFIRIVDMADPAYDGRAHVHRDLLTINEYKRGEGLAGWFNKNMQEVYLASGVEVVSIYAVDLSQGDPDTAGGPAVWASQGYDFDRSKGSAAYSSVKRAVESYAEDNLEMVTLPAAVQRNIRSVMERMENLDMEDDDFPTPREIWQLGRVGDIKGKTGWWPGKSILGHYGASQEDLERGWLQGPQAYYALDLTEGKRVTTYQIDAKDVRDRIAQNIVDARAGGPQQKTLPMDEQFITVNGQPIPLFPDEQSEPAPRGIRGSTTVPRAPDLPRFWPDGQPRLGNT